MQAGLGQPGLFLEHNGRYYLSEERLRQMKERVGM
jgi:hypothetical protein